MIQPTEYFDNYPLEATTFSSTPLDHEVWGVASRRARFQCWFTEALTAIANGYSVTVRVEQSDTFDFASFEEIGRGFTTNVETLGAPVGKILIDTPCVVTKRYTRMTFFIYGDLFGDGRISGGIQNLGLFGPYRAIDPEESLLMKHPDKEFVITTDGFQETRCVYVGCNSTATITSVTLECAIGNAGSYEFRVSEGNGYELVDGAVLYTSPAMIFTSGSIGLMTISGKYTLKRGLEYVIGMYRTDGASNWTSSYERSILSELPRSPVNLGIIRLWGGRVDSGTGGASVWMPKHTLTFEDAAVFPIGFDPLDSDDLIVTKNTTDLDVDESSYANRQVTVNTPVLWEDEIWIREVVPIRSDIKPALAPPWRPESFEAEFDRLVRIQQQQQEQLDRCVRLDTYETYDLDIIPATVPATGFWDIGDNINPSHGIYFTANEDFVIRGVTQWLGLTTSVDYEWHVTEGLGAEDPEGDLLYDSSSAASWLIDDDLSPRQIGGYFQCLKDNDYIISIRRSAGGSDWAGSYQKIAWNVGSQAPETHGPLTLRGGRTGGNTHDTMTHWQLQIERKVENLSESLFEESGYTLLGKVPTLVSQVFSLETLFDQTYKELIFEFIGTTWNDLFQSSVKPAFRILTDLSAVMSHDWCRYEVEADGGNQAWNAEADSRVYFARNYSPSGGINTKLSGELRLTYDDINQRIFGQCKMTRSQGFEMQFQDGSFSAVGRIGFLIMGDGQLNVWGGEAEISPLFGGGPIRVWGR